MDYGGNHVVEVSHPHRIYEGDPGAGEVSVSRNFASGHPFAQNSGTSFAAPRVAHAAAKILAEVNSSPNLCRALLVAHAQTPWECEVLFEQAGIGSEELLNITGYGQVDRSALYRSLDSQVTLWDEGEIENRTNHFYEIPIPEVFWEGRRRERELTLALAYCPAVRTTRIDYRASTIDFRLVKGKPLADVMRIYNNATNVEGGIPRDYQEPNNFGRWPSSTARTKGTVQASTWKFKQPRPKMRESSWVVVVSRRDADWGEELSHKQEKCALVATLSDRSAERGLLPALYAAIRERVQLRVRA